MARRYLEEFDSGAHSKYLLYYHLVCVTKYRRKVINESILPFIVRALRDVGKAHGVGIEQFSAEADHIHVMITAKPTTNLVKFIQSFKSASSRNVFQASPSLKQVLYGGHFWSPSYCLLTTGGAPIDIIRAYIEHQGISLNKDVFKGGD